ncbi:MAG: dihydrofolate reductase [Saprospiraceae bacterium]|nr:dihydrofolate reductase [Saprospiraceae bacterium]
MEISCIVAMNPDSVIGANGQIPWYLPADLKYFRKTTTPHHIIMGRQTYESIGKPLSNRINIVITRNAYYLSTGCLIAHSVEEALNIAADHGETEAFIIGGAQLYQSTVDLWDRLYLTTVECKVDGADAYFPRVDRNKWELISSESFLPDEKNKMPYRFEVFNKKPA